MSIEARQIQETLYSYAAILNFTPSPQGLRAKFGACSVQNAQLFFLCASYSSIFLRRNLIGCHEQEVDQLSVKVHKYIEQINKSNELFNILSALHNSQIKESHRITAKVSRL